MRCECADRECPVHKGFSECPNWATEHVRRVDLDDRSGVLFCDGCAQDAYESGVFSACGGD